MLVVQILINLKFVFFSHVTQTTQWTHPVSKVDHKAGSKTSPTAPKKSDPTPSYSKYRSEDLGDSNIEDTTGANVSSTL